MEVCTMYNSKQRKKTHRPMFIHTHTLVIPCRSAISISFPPLLTISFYPFGEPNAKKFTSRIQIQKKNSKKKEKTEKIWRGLQLNWLKVRKGQPAQQQK